MKVQINSGVLQLRLLFFLLLVFVCFFSFPTVDKRKCCWWVTCDTLHIWNLTAHRKLLLWTHCFNFYPSTCTHFFKFSMHQKRSDLCTVKGIKWIVFPALSCLYELFTMHYTTFYSKFAYSSLLSLFFCLFILLIVMFDVSVHYSFNELYFFFFPTCFVCTGRAFVCTGTAALTNMPIHGFVPWIL